MTLLPKLPIELADIKLKLQATAKSAEFHVDSRFKSTNERVIKTKRIRFDNNSILTFDILTYEWIVLYADIWDMYGGAEIRRTSNINLNGEDGQPGSDGEPTGRGYGANGNNGFPGGPGRDGKTIKVPTIFLFGRQMLWNGQQATPTDVKNHFFLSFDGYPGGNGGNGGPGGDGTNGNQGTPCEDAWYGYDCKSGPGWGGSGGNAGVGGAPRLVILGRVGRDIEEGLHRPERRLRPWPGRAEARRVRDLVEAVGQRLRADPDRLEQDGVPGIHETAPGRDG